MSAVETWITRNTHCFRREMKADHKWRIVRTEEIAVAFGVTSRGPRVSCTNAHMLSARFTILLHTVSWSCSGVSWQNSSQSAFAFLRTSFGTVARRKAPEARSRAVRHEQERKLCGKRLEKLLQRVHQSSDGAVQIFVRPPHLFDFVDRVQHRSVVLAAELAADFR
jgi:hypothetical protein